MEHPVTLLGSHFRPWGQTLWETIQGAVAAAELHVAAFVVNDHSQFIWQAWELMLQHPADLLHLSKPGLPAVLMDIDDEELCFVGEHEQIRVNELKREKGQHPPPEQLMAPL
jgi:hypothetical protein